MSEPVTEDLSGLDPLCLAKLCWPSVEFYKEQREIIYSVRDNDETIVPAANAMGKDFVSAFIALWFFLTRTPCRILTTSVDKAQLEGVLWGEIRRFLQTSRVKLPLVVNHCHLRQVFEGQVDGISYLMGRQAGKDEAVLGHHIARGPNGEPRTLFIADEASSIPDSVFEVADTWTHRQLIIGNTHFCTNKFYRAVNEGNLKARVRKGSSHLNDRYWRKVIKIRAQDSPNVQLAQWQEAAGGDATYEILIPGVKDYDTYLKQRELWDPVRQSIWLDAEFYEGAGVRLFPPEWLNAAEERARQLGNSHRRAVAIGVDPAEGGDDTSMAVVDEYGLIELISQSTPDTNIIPGLVLALMQKHKVIPQNVLFDAGGGGKQHADRLRAQGVPVRAVGFGEAASAEPKRGLKLLEDRKLDKETAYVYRNRRAEMYGILSLRLDPNGDGPRFAIPEEYQELRRQLAPIPRFYDDEGRLVLPPKNRKDPLATTENKRPTLTEILGRSPDDADALVLATFGMVNRARPSRVSSMV